MFSRFMLRESNLPPVRDMAKVQGPLHSINASGSIGRGQLIFRTLNNRTIAHIKRFDMRTSTPSQKAYHKLMKEANRYWKNLPSYLRFRWENTYLDQPHVKDDSPIRAGVKGRLLFFHYALHYLSIGERPRQDPFLNIPAPQVYVLSPRVFTIS